MRKRRVILLGSTGSIGTSAIKVAASIPDRMEMVGMAASQSAAALAESANRLRPSHLCLVDPAQLPELRRRLNYRPEVFAGEDGLEALARIDGADLVLVAIIGTAGFRPAMGAIETGKDLAVASKEILVMAGEIVMQRAREKGVQVFVHPQSIVHSMVEFVDGSILAQLSHSDMCFPIQYAVTWPDRVPHSLKPLCLSELGRLDFEEPRYDAFPALNLARRAGENGGVLPAILNAANEEAVQAFLQGRIPFPRIWSLVENAMEQVESFARPSLSDIMEADAKARAHVQGELEHH